MGDIIRKKRGSKDYGWYIRWVENGKRRQLASHQPTYALAKRMLLEIEARVARGLVGIVESKDPRESLTVKQVCDRFLAEWASPRVKDIEAYRQTAAYQLQRILPLIGDVKLDALGLHDIERARDKLSRSYPPNTVRSTVRPLGSALTWATKQGLLFTSPMRGLELPRRQTAVEFLDAEEVRQLLAEAERRARAQDCLMWWSRWVAVAIALHTGMRRGEVFGLRFSDVSLETQRLTIACSYSSLPKSGQARHLRLPTALIPLLREWRERCPKTAKAWICPVQDHGKWGMSGVRTPHGLPELLQVAGCKPLRRSWHALRHTFASHYVMQGGNILSLQRILGHSDIKMTLVYAHLAPDFLGAEMDRLKY